MSTGFSPSTLYSTRPITPLSPGLKGDSYLNAVAASATSKAQKFPDQHSYRGQVPLPPVALAQQKQPGKAIPSLPQSSIAGTPVSAPHYPDPRSAAFSPSGTPTSEYGMAPQSARSGNFNDYMQRPYHPSSVQQVAVTAAMAQGSSPSLTQSPIGDGSRSSAATYNSQANNGLPIDPSMASATSPTYPPPQPQYSPYTHSPDMTHYPGHPGVYSRPDWASGQYPGAPHMYAHSPVTSGPPPSLTGHLPTVYSFVPIPGAQQHKRPRRRYEEIERMYKCGWNGCEKAYGTLNHLNAHVTMQSHGAKRTPEEFKEIRKEWKQRKKEEEAARKAEEERRRQEDSRNVNNADSNGPPTADAPSTAAYPGLRQHIPQPPLSGGPQLPPIGYTPASQAPTQYSAPTATMDGGMSQYAAPSSQIYGAPNSNGSTFTPSPYSQSNHQIYQQSV